MQIQSGDTWHPWHRPINKKSACAEHWKESAVTQTSNHAHNEGYTQTQIDAVGPWMEKHSMTLRIMKALETEAHFEISSPTGRYFFKHPIPATHQIRHTIGDESTWKTYVLALGTKAAEDDLMRKDMALYLNGSAVRDLVAIVSSAAGEPPLGASQPAEVGRFLRGIGQWGGLYIYYTDPRVRLVERLEAQGNVTVDRSDSAYMVVALTEQSASHAPYYEMRDAIEQENERLMAQVEAFVNETPRMVYPALQVAASDLNKALQYVEEGGDDDLVRAAAFHLLRALYDTKLVSKSGTDEASS
jgi:hypothetical protein